LAHSVVGRPVAAAPTTDAPIGFLGRDGTAETGIRILAGA
jgi:hypothetical protein